jgi:hypothetical protein
MEVTFSSSFKKVFKKRIKASEIETEFWLRLEIFIKAPFDLRKKTQVIRKVKRLMEFFHRL